MATYAHVSVPSTFVARISLRARSTVQYPSKLRHHQLPRRALSSQPAYQLISLPSRERLAPVVQLQRPLARRARATTLQAITVSSPLPPFVTLRAFSARRYAATVPLELNPIRSGVAPTAAQLLKRCALRWPLQHTSKSYFSSAAAGNQSSATQPAPASTGHWANKFFHYCIYLPFKYLVLGYIWMLVGLWGISRVYSYLAFVLFLFCLYLTFFTPEARERMRSQTDGPSDELPAALLLAQEASEAVATAARMVRL